MKIILEFLNRMFKVIETTSSFILKGKSVKLEIGQGGSYTSGEYIHIGVPNQFVGLPLEIIYIMIIGLLGHEGQHVLSSNFEEFKRYNEEEVNKLVKKGVSRRFASHYVHAVGNIIEDGRVENILVNRLPGFIPKIQYLNMFFWGQSKVTEETSNFDAYLQAMLSLSVLGIYPKNYHILNGTKVDKEIDKIKHLINDGVKARTCKDGLDICREILKIAEPFVLTEYEKIKKDEEMMEAIMEFLEQLQEEHRNSQEEDYNESQQHSSHISNSEEDEKGENSDSSDGEGEGEGSSGDEDTDGKDSSSSSEKSEESKSEEDKKDRKSKPSKSEKEESEKEEKNNENNANKDKDNSSDDETKKKDTEDTKENKDDDLDKEPSKGDKESSSGNEGDTDENEDELKEKEDTNSLSDGVEAGGENNKRDASDDVEKKMEELAEKLKEEAKRDIEKSERDEKKKSKPSQGGELTDAEADKITKEIFEDLGFIEVKDKFQLHHSLPTDLQVSARKFKRQIKDIFDSKSLGSIGSQEKGVLDNENIFRVGMGDYNVFKTETMVNSSDHVVFILRDGSGSMSGEKDILSMNALAIIEEGIKGIVPFKAVTFSTGHNGVMHTVIKDWDDNSKKNYSHNYLHRYRAKGGNIDSVSIRIATEELLRRPEKDKTLIVLSDGFPYSLSATKESIKVSRSKGINLIGIMFGSDDFRERSLAQYKDMYQKNIIATSVDRIPNRLVAVLKDTLKQ